MASWTRTDGTPTVDDRAGALVAQQRGAPRRQVLERWRLAASAVRHAFETIDPSARLTWVAGHVAGAHARHDAAVRDVDPHQRRRGGARAGGDARPAA